MHRILFAWGPFVLFSYGLSLVVGFLAATWLARREALRHPFEVEVTADRIVDLTCLLMLGGILGGRLFFVLMHWPVYQRHPWEILAIWHGGLIWYGGLAGGLAAGWGYAKRFKLSLIRGADQVAPYLALAHAIGRIGCFLNGCCYGLPSSGWLGMHFPGVEGRVLPTQLFESVGLFLLCMVLLALRRPLRRPAGRLFGCYLASYAVLRFALEFLRQQPMIWSGLTLQQLISLAMFVAGLVFLLRRSGEAAS